MASQNSVGANSVLTVGDSSFEYFNLNAVDGAQRLPYTHKVLLENLLRTEDGANVTAAHIDALASWDPSAEPTNEIQFTPARVIMQDFTGVPCVVDLATMREAMVDLGVTNFVELGAGKVLTGLLKRIAPDATGVSASTPAEIEAVLKTL